MPKNERRPLSWTLNALWRASEIDPPAIIDPTQPFLSEKFDGLAFPLGWEMRTTDYIQRMGFIGAANVLEEEGRQRRVLLVAASLPNDLSPAPWTPSAVVFDLHHDGWDVTAANVLVRPEVAEVTMEPAVERCVGAISREVISAEATGTVLEGMPQYKEVSKVASLVLSASAVLLNAAAAQ